jgi:hypothetical protein
LKQQNVSNSLRKQWVGVTKGMDIHGNRKFWSEDDLLHGIATGLERELFQRGIKQKPHLNVTIDSDYFSEPLSSRIEEFTRDYSKGGRKRKVRVDMVLHGYETDRYPTSDTRGWDLAHRFALCAELKYFKHGRFADYYVDKTKDDIERLSLLKSDGVCEEAAMMVAADTESVPKSVLNNLRLMLNRSAQKYGETMSILRYQC